MRHLKLIAIFAALTAVAASVALADPGRNVEAVLRAAAAGPDNGFGLVKFRQPKDDDKIVYLDVWVRDLLHDHSYYLQRATDTNLEDPACTGTNWLTLGQANEPGGTTAITTDDHGTGRAALSRNLGVFPNGTQFDIHFRVVDVAAPTIPILESACYRFTVSQ